MMYLTQESQLFTEPGVHGMPLWNDFSPQWPQDLKSAVPPTLPQVWVSFHPSKTGWQLWFECHFMPDKISLGILTFNFFY